MKKRGFIIAMAALLMLAGCGKKQTTAPETTSAETAAEKTAEEAAEEAAQDEEKEADEESEMRLCDGGKYSKEEIEEAKRFLLQPGVNGLLRERFQGLEDAYLSFYQVLYQLDDDSLDKDKVYQAIEAIPDYEIYTDVSCISREHLDEFLTDITGYGLDSGAWDEYSTDYLEKEQVYFIQHGDTNYMPVDAEVVKNDKELLLLCQLENYEYQTPRFLVALEKNDKDSFYIRSVENAGINRGADDNEEDAFYRFTIVPDTKAATEKGILSLRDMKDQPIWTFETGDCPVAELEGITDIGYRENGYYLACAGAIYLIDRKSGELLWKTEEKYGGSQQFDFDKEGNLYLCGYYGPALAVIDKDGREVNCFEELNFPEGTDGNEFFWPRGLWVFDDGTAQIEYDSNDSVVTVDIKTGNVIDRF